MLKQSPYAGNCLYHIYCPVLENIVRPFFFYQFLRTLLKHTQTQNCSCDVVYHIIFNSLVARISSSCLSFEQDLVISFSLCCQFYIYISSFSLRHANEKKNCRKWNKKSPPPPQPHAQPSAVVRLVFTSLNTFGTHLQFSNSRPSSLKQHSPYHHPHVNVKNLPRVTNH
jgi:hypothetical protein